MYTAILILGLLLFFGIHSVRILAPAWRDARLASMGEQPWKGVYSLVSLAGFALLIVGYAFTPLRAQQIFIPPSWAPMLAVVVMAFAFVFMMVGNLPPGRMKPVLKHPFLLSVMLWALVHLIANGDAASHILFGVFLAWSVWDRIAVAGRTDALPEPGPVRQDVIAIVSGLVIWAVFIWFLHEWLIGVPVPIA